MMINNGYKINLLINFHSQFLRSHPCQLISNLSIRTLPDKFDAAMPYKINLKKKIITKHLLAGSFILFCLSVNGT